MATKIVTKNSSTGGSAPSASDLVQGELAVNVTDKRLYTENASGAIVELGTNPLGEITANGGIALGDNDKATFGASDDLQIYHDGTNSYVQDAGTGNLNIKSNGSFIDIQSDSTRINNAANNEIMATFVANGAVTLNYDNASKLATTVSGVQITQSGTDVGLLVTGGSYNYTAKFESSDAEANIIIEDSNSTNNGNMIGVATNDMYFITNATERFRIAADGSLSTPTAGTSNVRFGVNAGNSIASGGIDNTVVGDEAGTAITTGRFNTLIGKEAGDALNDADSNVAIGKGALSSDTQGSQSTAIGTLALTAQNFTSATDAYNVAVGAEAGAAVTTGVENTLIGGLAGDALTDADYNVAIGYTALSADTLGSRSVAIGRAALQAQNFTSATNAYNTAVGFAAGEAITTGVQNTLIGGLAGDALTTGNYNVAVGFEALGTEDAHGRCTALGFRALKTLNAGTDSYNVAIGYEAGLSVSTGTNNTFVGGLTGNSTNDGESNVGMGYAALAANCGNDNTGIGTGALNECTGSFNTALGRTAGNRIATGTNNMMLGRDSGETGSPGGIINGSTSDRIVLGDENITHAYIQVDWTVSSDQRDKTDFTALDLGLDFVKDLQPVTYKWDKRSKYGDKSAEDYDLNAQTPDGTHKEDWLDIGFKAQDVEALEIAAGYNKDNKTNLVSSHTGDGKQMGLQYSKFVPILVKAIQEQQALIESLTARIETLEG